MAPDRHLSTNRRLVLPGGDKVKSIIFRTLVVSSALALVLAGAAASAATGSFEQAFQSNGAVQLDVTTDSGTIEIHSSDSGRIEVIGKIKTKTRSFFGMFKSSDSNAQEIVELLESKPPISFEGGVLKVGHIEDKAVRRRVSISYEILVPVETEVKSHTGSGAQSISNVKGPVVASTGSGRVTLADIGGSADVRTGSGAIKADNIAGAFKAHSGSGSVSLTQTAPGDVVVTTGSGASHLHGVVGALQVKTGSGRVVVDGQQQGDWRIHTGSGAITVDLPDHASFSLDAETGSGGIDIDHPLTVQGRISKKHIRGDVRGGGHGLYIDAGSGGIRVK